MSEYEKPKIGDSVYVVNEGVNVRGNPSPPEYKEVFSVGRKYFKVGEKDSALDCLTLHIDGWGEKTEYCSNYSVYPSKEIYERELLEAKWARKFIGFRYQDVTLEQFEVMAKILEIEPPKGE